MRRRLSARSALDTFFWQKQLFLPGTYCCFLAHGDSQRCPTCYAFLSTFTIAHSLKSLHVGSFETDLEDGEPLSSIRAASSKSLAVQDWKLICCKFLDLVALFGKIEVQGGFILGASRISNLNVIVLA
ncbi:hypothetical protein HPP92_026845 [Vanilla planifolia]|uniref:Uncharacterized protein n=1 Tax=Vanilla planifolia TaxID=51239 RepID=A0A835PC41_VANPL|nr:hypothetical protein HPP92_026845 [Vanilla planifolia]